MLVEGDGLGKFSRLCVVLFQLRRVKDNRRVAALIDSVNLPQGEARFMITERGVVDVPEDVPEKKKEEEDG